MFDIFRILKSCWPFLRRYRGRLAVALVFGMLYGLSNASAVWGVRLLFDRMAPPPSEAQAAATGTGIASTTAARPAPDHARRWIARVESRLKEHVDAWLPMAGRPLDGRQVAGTVLLLPLLLSVRGVCNYVSAYSLTWAAARTVNDFRVAILEHLSRLCLDFYSRARSGDLITRVSTDTANLQRTLTLTFSQLIQEPMAAISILILLFAVNWQLALFSLVFLPLCAGPVFVLGRRAKRSARQALKANSQQAELLVEFLAGIRVVKAFELEHHRLERFRSLARELIRQVLRGVRAKELINPIIEVVAAIALSILVLYIAATQARFADMVTFLAGSAALYPSVRRLAGLHVVFTQARAAMDRIEQVLQEEPTVREPAAPVPLPGFRDAIRFENVSFGYGDEVVLEDFNLVIPRGMKLGVAGVSGSGKSTIINLLYRFYDPRAGSVTIDGIDLRHVASSDLRRHLALVSQEVVIFDFSVAENIACGRPGATREEVEAAARAAFAHDFIMALPHGYDTPVGERGVTLSGGQRQRIAIARAFIRNAPILVLDEATASLDSEAEREVQSAIERLEEDRTVVCVAHRLSTLRNMDRIVVLANGRIVEDGTFDEMLRAGGPFAAMARMQGIVAPGVALAGP